VRRLLPILAIVFVAFLGLRLPSRAQDDDKKEKGGKDAPLLTALGGVSASSAYFTFCFIGTVADGFEKGNYDAKQVKTFAGEAVLMMGRNAAQMKKLKEKGGLAEADAKTIGDFATVFSEIEDYAKALQAYSDKKDKEHADKFQEARQKAWKHLKTLLGIKDD